MQITEEVRGYWNLRSEGFSKSVQEEAQYNGESTAAYIIEEIGVDPNSKILDVGCGPGYFTLILSQYGMNVTGIDYSEDMLEQARKNAAEKQIDAEFFKMDASDISFPSNVFDVVICRNVLWNLERPVQAYSEMIRVLRPGGKVIIQDGNYYYHLFSKEYDDERQRFNKEYKEEQRGSHDKYRGDVDFSIIEKLAKDLPLSKELRPAWDVSVLQTLPCSDLKIKMISRHLDENKTHRLVFGFTIIVSKETVHV